MAHNDNSGENLFQRFFSSLFKSSDPEAEKKRQLKAIAKHLSHSKYKFYKFNSDEALPAMGKFFYELYKALNAAQAMFNSIQNPNAIKNMVIEYSLTEQQKKTMDCLTEEYIKEQAKTVPIRELSAQINSNIAQLSKGFDSEQITKIDRLYAKLSAFRALCTFDYYFLLKKFDTNLKEHDFSSVPKFETIRAEYVAEELKDFIAVAWAVPVKENWSDVMGVFKMMKGVEPIAAGLWTKVLSRITDLKSSAALEMIIRLITKNPDFAIEIQENLEPIIEPQIDKIRAQAEAAIKKIELEQKNSQVDKILSVIFGTTSVTKLKNYTENGSLLFAKKMIGEYTMHQPLNYMKAFLIDYFKRSVREFADLVLIRGKWQTATLSNEMSDSYHALLDVSEQITVFDNSLAEDSSQGIKIRNMLLKADHDKEAKRLLTSTLKDINTKATRLVQTGSQELVVFARHVKSVLEDHEKHEPVLLINWKELDRFAETPIKENAVSIYKMIYQFITLMQFYIKKDA